MSWLAVRTDMIAFVLASRPGSKSDNMKDQSQERSKPQGESSGNADTAGHVDVEIDKSMAQYCQLQD